MNNDAGSFSMLSDSRAERRSENFRRNFDTIDQLVAHLRSQRANEETQTENMDTFDRTATLYTPPTARQLRRPATRAAGYDSRPINSNSNL
jgi:hypothetical protein